jgi:hypothetical protein
MMGYHETKKSLAKTLIAKAKEEIKFLEEEIYRLQKMAVKWGKTATKTAYDIASNAEPGDPPHTIYSIAAKSKTKNNGAIARKPKKRKYTKKSKYWKK